jgi:DNA-binding CsgD family transcriptional regulator
MNERKLLDLIDSAYAAALDPEGWQTFVDGLSRAYGGLAALYMQDTETLASRITVFAGTDQSYADQFENYYCFKNVWYQKKRRLGEILAGDVAESREVQRSEYYADWLKPQGFSSSIVTPVMIQGSSVLNVVLLRAATSARFRDTEIEVWTRLVPHMVRAVEVRQKCQVSQLQRDSALLALDDLQVGVILVSPEGRLLLSNPAAEQVLSSGSGLRIVSGCLCAETPAATSRLHRLIFESAHTGTGKGTHPGGTMALPSGNGPPLAVMVSPVPVSGGALASMPMAMLLLTDPRKSARVDKEALERLYGLTPAQAQLLQALVDGRRLTDYADEAGLSINTVKSHMKQIFEKTGENRQADLVRQVLANPLLKRA